MFSKRTIAAIGAFSLITAIAATGRAQPRHHAKDADPDADTDSDADTDTPRPKAKSKAKSRAKAKDADTDSDADADVSPARSKTKSRSKAKSRAKAKDADTDSDADAEAEAQREREREAQREQDKENERERERARAREKEQAAADADAANAKAKDKATTTEAELTANNGAGGGEAYQSGTLGFSIPITAIGAATAGGGGEPVPTVDIVYFLDNTAALDLILGVNVHRKHAAAVATGMGTTAGGGDSTLIGASAGLGYRMYSSKNGLRAFLEPQAVISLPDTSNTDTLTINLGGLFGVERNLTPWFSISGAIGATVNLASSFKDIQLATAANLAANLYWR
ncbi:MAG TPA: hypothetical protein VHW23_42745 [Kofleriaceae bacterium]|jgi:hypothetical protein|nr:hypothetical protein [Kofleriaceae bacterium]